MANQRNHDSKLQWELLLTQSIFLYWSSIYSELKAAVKS